jgi:DNA-directed RNA polymerase subunit RPC12/RpoP
MGRGISIRCGTCSAKQDFLLGVGWDYFSLDTVISALHPGRRAEVRTILQGRDLHQRESGWRIYLCGECKRLYNRFWLKLEYGDNQNYETEYECSCGGKLYQFLDLGRISDLRCSRCGEKTLVMEDQFLWD